MCGIAGFLRTMGRGAAESVLDAMLAPLASRGPDASGVWTQALGDRVLGLGHRRLAILDLSPEAGQPMARGDLVLVHNGEIYNYVELRRDLETRGHAFSTTGDTEVILAAYRQWGQACVERFNGMFAFALWDARERRLFCARDRMGEKPFFYRATPDGVVFGSEIKAVLAFGHDTPRRVNGERVHAFLRESWQARSDATFFEGVEELPPAHTLVVTVDGARSSAPRITRYWDLPHHDPSSPPLGAEEVRARLDEAVRLRLRSDVPVGTSLSGGVDSPSVVASVLALAETDASSFRPIGVHAFAKAPGCDERPFVEALARALDVRVETVELTGEACAQELDDLLYRQEEPFLGPSIYAQRRVFRRASELGLKVMLDGQGADELFGGYDWAVPKALAAMWRTQGLTAARAAARSFRAPRFPRGRLWAQIAMSRFRGRTRGLPDDLHVALKAAVTDLSLPALLRYADRNSMSYGVETRLPFLDHRLVEAASRLRGEDCVRGGFTKAILREAMRDRVPATVLDRKDKTAFAVPELDWLRGPLRADVEAAARDPLWADITDGAAFCRQALAELEGAAYQRMAWKILCTSRWHARFFK